MNCAHPSEPNRNSMLKPVGGWSVLAFFAVISILKNEKPIRQLRDKANRK